LLAIAADLSMNMLPDTQRLFRLKQHGKRVDQVREGQGDSEG